MSTWANCEVEILNNLAFHLFCFALCTVFSVLSHLVLPEPRVCQIFTFAFSLTFHSDKMYSAEFVSIYSFVLISILALRCTNQQCNSHLQGIFARYTMLP